MNAPRAMGLAPARAETPQAAQGRSPAGPVTGEAGQAPLCPSESQRSIIYSSLIYDIFSPEGGACLTSGPVSGINKETNDGR
jgi:hypothetical protein